MIENNEEKVLSDEELGLEEKQVKKQTMVGGKVKTEKKPLTKENSKGVKKVNDALQNAAATAAIKAAIAADSLPGQVQNPTTVYKGVDYSAEFNPQVYYNNNPDLQAALGTDGKALIKHYVEFGKQEGRKAK